MKKNHILHIIVAGIALGACSAAALAAGTEAAEAAAETEIGSQLLDALSAAANFLPFPWNVFAASVLTAAGAVWAWRRKQQATDNS